MGFFKKAKDVNHLVNARANKKRAVSERSPGSPRTMRSPAPLGTYAFPQSSNTVYSPTARFNGSGSPSFLQVAKSPRNTYSTCTTRSAVVQRLSFMHDMHVSGPNVPDIASTNNSRATPVIYDMDASAPNVPDIASTINTRITPLHTSPVISYRHRTRFSDLKTRDEKMRAVHDIGKVVGGDLVGAMKFAFQNLKTVGPTLASKLNAPESLETEILELFRDIFPDKNTSLMPGREYNNSMLSNPIAVAIDQSESYKTLKVRNQHVDPTLSIGDFSVLIRGRRFTLLSYGRLCFP